VRSAPWPRPFVVPKRHQPLLPPGRRRGGQRAVWPGGMGVGSGAPTDSVPSGRRQPPLPLDVYRRGRNMNALRRIEYPNEPSTASSLNLHRPVTRRSPGVYQTSRLWDAFPDQPDQSRATRCTWGGSPMREAWRRREALVSTLAQRIVALSLWASSQDSVGSASPIPAAGP
jgi:hypothetical protein